jgi:hypothetical protein
MNITDYGKMLVKQRDTIRITSPIGTALYKTASDNLEMINAYIEDGFTFLESGNGVNALAAFFYSLGWLHFGITYGFFATQESDCPLFSPIELPITNLREQLEQKTQRYRLLLDTACAAAVPAPEEETVIHDTVERILMIISIYAMQGNRSFLKLQNGNALMFFSYGHGWLDAAVRAGLLRVISDRDLFTL